MKMRLTRPLSLPPSDSEGRPRLPVLEPGQHHPVSYNYNFNEGASSAGASQDALSDRRRPYKRWTKEQQVILVGHYAANPFPSRYEHLPSENIGSH